ncbi:MAG: ABC-type permease component [Dehalococcoidia bacterium]|nr:ABC-type permease component [Dehalococcoidia bacterium]
MLRFRRERARAVSAVMVPLLFLVLMGSGLNQIVVSPAPGLDFADFIFPGIVIMSLFMTAFSAGMSVVWEREFGFLKEVLVAPVSRAGVAMGKVLGSSTAAMLQAGIIVGLAPLVGVQMRQTGVLPAMVILFLTSVTIAGMGTFVGSRMRSMQGFHVISELLLLPLMFLSGAFFPVDMVPQWLGFLARFNFVTYAADGIRQSLMPALSGDGPGGVTNYMRITVFGNYMSVVGDTAIVAAFAIAMLTLASWSFNRNDME